MYPNMLTPMPHSEWVLLDAAVHSYSMVSVPLYDTLGPESVEYICNHAELACVGCSAQVLPTLMECLPRCPTVKVLVSAYQWIYTVDRFWGRTYPERDDNSVSALDNLTIQTTMIY